MPVIVLAGEEEFALSKRLIQLKMTLLSPAWQVVNFIKINKPTIALLREKASTIPFGQGNRIVLVENCEFFTKKKSKTDESIEEDDQPEENLKSKSGNKGEDDLESVFTSIPSNTYLIFACPYNFDSSLKLSKMVAKHADIEEFVKEKYFPVQKISNWKIFAAKKQKNIMPP